jgi:hypothetical protein
MGYTSKFSFVGQNFLPRAGLATDLVDRNLNSFCASGVHDPHHAKNRRAASVVHGNQVTAARFDGNPGQQCATSAQIGRQGRFVKDLSVRVQAGHFDKQTRPNSRLFPAIGHSHDSLRT